MLTGNTCKYSIAGSVMAEGVASTLYAGSLKHNGLFTCVMVIHMNDSVRCGCFVVILLSVKQQHKLELLEKPGYIILISRVMENGIWEEKQGILQIKKSLKYWLNAIQKASLLFHTKWFRLFTISFMSSLPISDIYLRNTKTAFEEPSISTKAQIHTFSQSRLENIAAIWLEIVLSEHPYLNVKKPEHNSKNVVSGLVVWSSCSKLIWVEKKRLIAEFYQNIDSSISGRYTVSAPYKAGVGIGVLEFNIEHNRAHAVFSYHEHCYVQIMVRRAGASQDAPGSMLTGYANPVRLTTSVIGVPCGEFFEFNIGAVTMTTFPTHPFLKIEIVNGKAVTTSLFEYLKLLRLAGVPGYISRVAVNPATGLRIPKHHTGLTRHKRVFLSTHVYSMAAQMGASSEAPVFPCVSGNANPVWAATNHGFASVGGSCKAHTQGAVTMTTITTHPFLKIEIVNGKAVIFSLHVACHFKRMHQNIVDKIEYLNCSREFFTRNFIPGTYHIYGDSLRGYYITLDGLMMLQLGLSLRTMRYYESCIEAFHEAETSLNHTAFRRNQWEVRP